jgi:hypothetical protein
MLYIKITFVSATGNCVRKNFIYLIEPNHLADYLRCGMQTKIKKSRFVQVIPIYIYMITPFSSV